MFLKIIVLQLKEIDNMIEEVVKQMLEDVKKHNRTKDELLAYYIQTRLDKSIKTYYQQLLESYNFLSNVSDESKIIKKLAKL